MAALRQFFAASVLVLTLAVSISAGEITTGITSPQTPPTTEGDIHTGITGDMHTMGADAVALIESLLSLF